MSVNMEFSCNFCGSSITQACKHGARGYCGVVREREVVRWSLNPETVIRGPHICEQCVRSLVNSPSFSEVGRCDP